MDVGSSLLYPCTSKAGKSRAKCTGERGFCMLRLERSAPRTSNPSGKKSSAGISPMKWGTACWKLALKIQVWLLTAVALTHENYTPLLFFHVASTCLSYSLNSISSDAFNIFHPLKGFSPSTTCNFLWKWRRSSPFFMHLPNFSRAARAGGRTVNTIHFLITKNIAQADGLGWFITPLGLRS